MENAVLVPPPSMPSQRIYVSANQMAAMITITTMTAAMAPMNFTRESRVRSRTFASVSARAWTCCMSSSCSAVSAASDAAMRSVTSGLSWISAALVMVSSASAISACASSWARC